MRKAICACVGVWASAFIVGIVEGLVSLPRPDANLTPQPKPKLETSDGMLEAAADWSGVYHASGIEVRTNETYTAVATILPLATPGVYSVNYLLIGKSGAVMKGIGRAVDGKFIVAWTGASEARGLTVYVATSDGAEGTWCVLPGDGAINRETLTWLKEVD